MNEVRTNGVASSDTTTIGYRQVGQGPGLVILHGAMEWSLSHIDLAQALADAFTVYLPDRRGRGLSGAYAADHSAGRDIEDLDAILTETGARYLFGVSSGAIVSLLAALELDTIHKVAIFEPPLFPNDREPTAILERFDTEMAQGKLSAALVAGMQGAQMGPAFLNAVPPWLLRPLAATAMRKDDRNGADGHVTMRTLAPTLHYDFSLALEASGGADRFSSISADMLLLEGSKSPTYLKAAVAMLAEALPRARRVELPGVGHGAAGNTDQGGQPGAVAAELRRFFPEQST